MTKRKPVAVRRVKVAGETTPKFLMGDTVFTMSGNIIIERNVTAILLTSEGFMYTCEEYDRPGRISLAFFKPESELYASREELKASL